MTDTADDVSSTALQKVRARLACSTKQKSEGGAPAELRSAEQGRTGLRRAELSETHGRD